MPHPAIIVVSAQISLDRWEIIAHHGSEAGERRANALVRDLIPYPWWILLR